MVTEIDRHETRRLVEEDDAQFVEVLPPSAYHDVHLPGAINLPLKEFRPDRMAELDRERPVIVYCSGFL